MHDPADLPFFAIAAAYAMPFAISWAIARLCAAPRRPWADRLKAAGCFVAGCGFGQLAMAYAIAADLPPEWGPPLRIASAVLAVIAAGTAFALVDPDPNPLDELARMTRRALGTRRRCGTLAAGFLAAAAGAALTASYGLGGWSLPAVFALLFGFSLAAAAWASPGPRGVARAARPTPPP